MSTVSSQLPTDFQPLLFNSLGSRQVVTDFSAGHLSSDGGMLLLRQLDEGLGLSRSLAGCFRDLRNPLLIEHSVRELVAQRLLGLAAGYEDLNDHNLLRLDPLFAVAVGKEDPLGTGRALPDQGKALASASTLNRLELGNNKNTRCHKISAHHEEIAETLLQMGVRSLPKHSQEVVIDLDASDNPLHGQQEGRFFHGFYGCYCYLPLYAFVGSVPLWAELRTSDGDAARGAVDIAHAGGQPGEDRVEVGDDVVPAADHHLRIERVVRTDRAPQPGGDHLGRVRRRKRCGAGQLAVFQVKDPNQRRRINDLFFGIEQDAIDTRVKTPRRTRQPGGSRPHPSLKYPVTKPRVFH